MQIDRGPVSVALLTEPIWVACQDDLVSDQDAVMFGFKFISPRIALIVLAVAGCYLAAIAIWI